MADSLAAVVLAAGAGTRLAPLTLERPKALCPVGGVALVDRAVARVRPLTADVAVNAHHGAEAVVAHLAAAPSPPHLSRERRLLGTGGALGALREWIGGRAVLVVNSDTVHAGDLGGLVDGWDGERIRLLLAEPAGTPFRAGVRLCGALMPWAAVGDLAATPASVYDTVWAPWAAAGRVEAVAGYDGPWFDCGTPAAYLAANLWTSGGSAVVGEDAEVQGTLVRAVVWDRSRVRPSERLVDAIRTTAGRTVLVRWRRGRRPSTTVPRWTL